MKKSMVLFAIGAIFIGCNNSNKYKIDSGNFDRATTTFFTAIYGVEKPLSDSTKFFNQNGCLDGNRTIKRTDKGVDYKFTKCLINSDNNMTINGNLTVLNDAKTFIIGQNGINIKENNDKNISVEYRYKSGKLEFDSIELSTAKKIDNFNYKININNGKHNIDVKNLNLVKDDQSEDTAKFSATSDIIDNKSIDLDSTIKDGTTDISIKGDKSSVKLIIKSIIIDQILVNDEEQLQDKDNVQKFKIIYAKDKYFFN